MNSSKFSESFKQLETLVPNLLSKFNAPGISIGVIEKCKLTKVHHFGYADREEKKEINDNTKFQLASISKPIAAWGVMKLVERGIVRLEDPIMKYITRWKLPQKYESYIVGKYGNYGSKAPPPLNFLDITIKQVLSHTAGLSLPGYRGFPPWEPLPSIEESLSGNTYYSGDVRVIYPPGDQFIYSGGGYTLLQLLIEETTQMKFANFMQQEILAPLGMNSSLYSSFPENEKNLAKPYGDLGYPEPICRYTALAAAGCISTVRDLAKFAIANLKGENHKFSHQNVLSDETINLIHTPITKSDVINGIDNFIGLGTFIMEMQGVKILQHSGGNRGYRTMWVSIPDFGAGLVLLTNSHPGLNVINVILDKYAEYVMQNLS